MPAIVIIGAGSERSLVIPLELTLALRIGGVSFGIALKRQLGFEDFRVPVITFFLISGPQRLKDL
jgi:hypothetical protein